jgi:hypothetical protein
MFSKLYVGQPKPLRPDVNVTASRGKSAVAKRILDTGHKIYFDNTYRLSKVNNYVDLEAMSVAIEIYLNAKNFNRVEDLVLHGVGQPIIRLLKHRKEALREGLHPLTRWLILSRALACKAIIVWSATESCQDLDDGDRVLL